MPPASKIVEERRKGRQRHIETTIQRARMRTIDSQVNAGAPMTVIEAVLFGVTEAFVLGILLALLFVGTRPDWIRRRGPIGKIDISRSRQFPVAKTPPHPERLKAHPSRCGLDASRATSGRALACNEARGDRNRRRF